MNKSFTLVSTVFNEGKRLKEAILDIEAQTLKPQEIIIIDGGSNDETWDILLNWKSESDISIILEQFPCNVAEGRNRAILLSNTDVIVSTDFGCRFDKKWLEVITQPIFENEEVEVVGGGFTVDHKSLNSLAAKSDFILSKGYNFVDADNFSVSSRSIAYRKYVWEEIDGYPEWLTLAADDTIFWRLIKKHNFKYKILLEPLVLWERHSTYGGFAKESQRYGLGDGESRINFKNFISHVVETGCRYLMIPAFLFIFLFAKSTLNFLFLLPLFFGLRSYKNAVHYFIKYKRPNWGIEVLAASFLMVEVTRYNYIKYYLKGLMFRTEEQRVKSQRLLELIS